MRSRSDESRASDEGVYRRRSIATVFDMIRGVQYIFSAWAPLWDARLLLFPRVFSSNAFLLLATSDARAPMDWSDQAPMKSMAGVGWSLRMDKRDSLRICRSGESCAALLIFASCTLFASPLDFVAFYQCCSSSTDPAPITEQVYSLPINLPQQCVHPPSS